MKRIYVFISTSDPVALAVVAEATTARAQADVTLGISNWREFDVTTDLLPAAADLVNLARERARTQDGSGRWRWRTIANVVKRWLAEPVDELCETCGSKWPTAPAP